ncbi:P-type conjugative transfer protein TrbG [Phenylobacterium sp.]|uniref:P-type conjugative transfer protein TrbG n=1 Tax=Phenylobacterium sp. TaxID=1871053 RepID=UPI0035B11213
MRALLMIALALLAPGAAVGGPPADVGRANQIARVEPRPDAFANAAQVFTYSEAALYQIYAAPGQITDLVLQPGEQLVGEGALAAGDTDRWIIGETRSGTGTDQRVHILVKPAAPGLSTNLVVNTDRRTYHLELRSSGGPHLAVARWRYPVDEAKAAALARSADAERRRAAPGPPPVLNFDYRIIGRASWRPLRTYDDGRQTFVEFGPGIERDDLPPIFLVGPRGEAELVEFRVEGRRMIVDRVFDRAELRLRRGRSMDVVRLQRLGSGS